MANEELARDGTAEPVALESICQTKTGTENFHFRCSADHKTDLAIKRLNNPHFGERDKNKAILSTPVFYAYSYGNWAAKR